MKDFDQALDFVLAREGGYVNDPADPGGATNKGVTQRTYDEYRKGHEQALRPVKDIDDEEVGTIYFYGYWKAAGCDKLPWPLSLVQFDTAVNMGTARARKLLAESKCDVPEYLRLRRAYYAALAKIRPAMGKFLKGWLRRVDLLEQEGKK